MRNLSFSAFAAVIALLLTACGGSGSKTLEISKLEIVPYDNNELFKASTELFSVVPGSYELSWHPSNEYKEYSMFNITLKLRLEKKIDWGTIEIDDRNLSDLSTIGIDFLDADGNFVAQDPAQLCCFVGKSTNDDKDDKMKLAKLLTEGNVGDVAEITFQCMPLTETDKEALIDKASAIRVYSLISVNLIKNKNNGK